jgi:alkanesulfonate monooxygenase SsuD/methylene tetrahydromethanopterin reductase-like flavin-dependent oxidoreductase (luciferase family)
MSPLQFGVFLSPDASRRNDVLAQALAAEAAGLDFVGIQDHPYQRRFLDTWVLIGHLLARTTRIRAFPAVANLPLRPPAMMAKEAASLDLLSDGRFELGLGAGGFLDAAVGMGAPRRTAGESVEAVEEAIGSCARRGRRPVRCATRVPTTGSTTSPGHHRLIPSRFCSAPSAHGCSR